MSHGGWERDKGWNTLSGTGLRQLGTVGRVGGCKDFAVGKLKQWGLR